MFETQPSLFERKDTLGENLRHHQSLYLPQLTWPLCLFSLKWK